VRNVPDIGVFHPQVVHFVIALLFVGVACRIIAFSGKPKFLNSAATLLILLGTAASVVAVKSGEDAHGPAERIPGAREAVLDHEEWGERTRNVFLAVAALEIITLLLMKREGAARVFRWGSAAIGLVGAFLLYEAAEHGGEIVYSYAGGVGTRSGEAEDVERLLIAGLHQKATLEREAGNKEEAARLIEEMARQRPTDIEIQLTYASSLLTDRGDPSASMGRLQAIRIPEGNETLDVRHGMIMADVYQALNQPDSARLFLEALAQRYPESPRLRTRLDRMRAGS
jgi:uncharacterized membrane protein